MNIISTVSKNGIVIRLTEERWKHICLIHPSLADKQTNYILKGGAGELLAIAVLSKRAYLAVVYKEEISDGFIITAFETNDTCWLFKKELIWSKPS